MAGRRQGKHHKNKEKECLEEKKEELKGIETSSGKIKYWFHLAIDTADP